jgi:hypothetical protein
LARSAALGSTTARMAPPPDDHAAVAHQGEDRVVGGHEHDLVLADEHLEGLAAVDARSRSRRSAHRRARQHGRVGDSISARDWPPERLVTGVSRAKGLARERVGSSQMRFTLPGMSSARRLSACRARKSPTPMSMTKFMFWLSCATSLRSPPARQRSSPRGRRPDAPAGRRVAAGHPFDVRQQAALARAGRPHDADDVALAHRQLAHCSGLAALVAAAQGP